MTSALKQVLCACMLSVLHISIKKKGKFIFSVNTDAALLLTCSIGGSSKTKSGPWCSSSCCCRPKATKRA